MNDLGRRNDLIPRTINHSSRLILIKTLAIENKTE